jgi:cytochrome P450
MSPSASSVLTQYAAAPAHQKVSVLISHLKSDFEGTCRELRQQAPFLQTPVGTFVTRFQDVERVLRSTKATAVERQNCQGTLEFSVQEPGLRMEETLGAFFLGFDVDKTRYCEHLRAAKQVLNEADIAVDLSRIQARAHDLAMQLVDGLQVNQFDVVTEYGNKVPTEVMAEYFGFLPAPPVDAATLTADKALDLFQIVSFYVFNPLALAPDAKGNADAAAEEIKKFARARVAEVQALANKPDTVLKRLLGTQPPTGEVLDDWAMRMMVGLFSASVVASVGLFANVIDGLTHGRNPLDTVDPDAGDAVRDLVREAMRRGPYPSLLQRNAAAAIEITSAGGLGYTFKQGEKIIVVLGSAMRDEAVFGWDSDTFRAGRDVEKMRLAFGLQHYHQCLGFLHAEILLVEMVKALVRKARASGGTIQRVGEPPSTLVRDPKTNVPRQLLLKIA